MLCHFLCSLIEISNEENILLRAALFWCRYYHIANIACTKGPQLKCVQLRSNQKSDFNQQLFTTPTRYVPIRMKADYFPSFMSCWRMNHTSVGCVIPSIYPTIKRIMKFKQDYALWIGSKSISHISVGSTSFHVLISFSRSPLFDSTDCN